MLQSESAEACPGSFQLTVTESARLYDGSNRPALRHIVSGATKTNAPSRRMPGSRGYIQSQVSDDDLIERIAERDTAAMRILYVRYRAKVFNYIRRLVRHRETAEDLVSQVFLDAWNSAGTFECRSRVSTWLLAIGRFKALHHFRQRKYERIDDVEMPEIVDDAESPDATIDQMRLNTILRSCVHKLRPTQRKVVDLVYYQEKSIIEASEALGVPCATIKTRMFYARKELAILLESAGIGRAGCEVHQHGALSTPWKCSVFRL